MLFDPVPRIFARRARSVLGSQLPTRLEAALAKAYLQRLEGLKAEKTVGAKMTMRLVVANAALLDVCLAEGLDRNQSIDMIASVNRTLLAFPMRFLYHMSRMVGTDAARRMDWVWELLNRWFPFSSPGWELKPVVQQEAGRVVASFDYCRCPIADYCGPRNLVDLCTGALCSLDYLLEEPSGLKLMREETLVEGGGRCTFRWHRG